MVLWCYLSGLASLSKSERYLILHYIYQDCLIWRYVFVIHIYHHSFTSVPYSCVYIEAEAKAGACVYVSYSSHKPHNKQIMRFVKYDTSNRISSVLFKINQISTIEGGISMCFFVSLYLNCIRTWKMLCRLTALWVGNSPFPSGFPSQSSCNDEHVCFIWCWCEQTVK